MLKLKKIKPMFNSIVTTMDKYEGFAYTEGGLIDGSKKQDQVKEYQRVLEVGSSVRDIAVGDIVQINPKRFAVMKHQKGSIKDNVITDNPVIGYNFPIVELNGKQCLLITDNDVDFIVEDFEDIPDPEPTKLYTPGDKSLLV